MSDQEQFTTLSHLSQALNRVKTGCFERDYAGKRNGKTARGSLQPAAKGQLSGKFIGRSGGETKRNQAVANGLRKCVAVHFIVDKGGEQWYNSLY
jgi:hypothetical protein